MKPIPDDPIIECMMRTGYPPWMQKSYRDLDDDYFYYPEHDDEEDED